MTYLTTFTTKDSGNGYAIINAPNSNTASKVCQVHSRFNTLPDFKVHSLEEFHTHHNCETGIIAEGITSAPESLYDIAVRLGFKGSEQDYLNSLKGDKGEQGDKGDKGDDGTVNFDDLKYDQLQKLLATSVVELQLDPGSYNAISSRVVYNLYTDLLEAIKVNNEIVNTLLESKIEAINNSPIIYIKLELYTNLINTNTYNPNAFYAIISEDEPVPTLYWTFGLQFPIILGGEINTKFTFGSKFPIQF